MRVMHQTENSTTRDKALDGLCATSKELETELGREHMTLYLWWKREGLPRIKVRHNVYYDRIEVHEWLKQHRPHLAYKLSRFEGRG